MADEYLTDDEQAEALKSWWRENWAWVIAGIVLGVALLLGWQYYQRYLVQRAAAAATTLDQYAGAIVSDQAKAASLFKEMMDKYQATPYSLQAQLLKAQHAVEINDLPGAETALRAVMANGKDPELGQVARQRLARVLIEQGKYDEALALLDITKAGGFVARAHEIRGDALLAKQDQTAAIAEYQAALAAYQNDSGADVSLLQIKLTDLGADVVTASTDAVAQASTK
jgi:predicted negative regulator of RcsB-dependent stress response